MLKKNCHKVFGSQKSKLTVLEKVFQTARIGLTFISVITFIVFLILHKFSVAKLTLESQTSIDHYQ